MSSQVEMERLTGRPFLGASLDELALNIARRFEIKRRLQAFQLLHRYAKPVPVTDGNGAVGPTKTEGCRQPQNSRDKLRRLTEDPQSALTRSSNLRSDTMDAQNYGNCVASGDQKPGTPNPDLPAPQAATDNGLNADIPPMVGSMVSPPGGAFLLTNTGTLNPAEAELDPSRNVVWWMQESDHFGLLGRLDMEHVQQAARAANQYQLGYGSLDDFRNVFGAEQQPVVQQPGLQGMAHANPTAAGHHQFLANITHPNHRGPEAQLPPIMPPLFAWDTTGASASTFSWTPHEPHGPPHLRGHTNSTMVDLGFTAEGAQRAAKRPMDDAPDDGPSKRPAVDSQATDPLALRFDYGEMAGYRDIDIRSRPTPRPRQPRARRPGPAPTPIIPTQVPQFEGCQPPTGTLQIAESSEASMAPLPTPNRPRQAVNPTTGRRASRQTAAPGNRRGRARPGAGTTGPDTPGEAATPEAHTPATTGLGPSTPTQAATPTAQTDEPGTPRGAVTSAARTPRQAPTGGRGGNSRTRTPRGLQSASTPRAGRSRRASQAPVQVSSPQITAEAPPDTEEISLAPSRRPEGGNGATPCPADAQSLPGHPPQPPAPAGGNNRHAQGEHPAQRPPDRQSLSEHPPQVPARAGGINSGMQTRNAPIFAGQLMRQANPQAMNMQARQGHGSNTGNGRRITAAQYHAAVAARTNVMSSFSNQTAGNTGANPGPIGQNNNTPALARKDLTLGQVHHQTAVVQNHMASSQVHGTGTQPSQSQTYEQLQARLEAQLARAQAENGQMNEEAQARAACAIPESILLHSRRQAAMALTTGDMSRALNLGPGGQAQRSPPAQSPEKVSANVGAPRRMPGAQAQSLPLPPSACTPVQGEQTQSSAVAGAPNNNFQHLHQQALGLMGPTQIAPTPVQSDLAQSIPDVRDNNATVPNRSALPSHDDTLPIEGDFEQALNDFLSAFAQPPGPTAVHPGMGGLAQQAPGYGVTPQPNPPSESGPCATTAGGEGAAQVQSNVQVADNVDFAPSHVHGHPGTGGVLQQAQGYGVPAQSDRPTGTLPSSTTTDRQGAQGRGQSNTHAVDNVDFAPPGMQMPPGIGDFPQQTQAHSVPAQASRPTGVAPQGSMAAMQGAQCQGQNNFQTTHDTESTPSQSQRHPRMGGLPRQTQGYSTLEHPGTPTGGQGHGQHNFQTTDNTDFAPPRAQMAGAPNASMSATPRMSAPSVTWQDNSLAVQPQSPAFHQAGAGSRPGEAPTAQQNPSGLAHSAQLQQHQNPIPGSVQLSQYQRQIQAQMANLGHARAQQNQNQMPNSFPRAGNHFRGPPPAQQQNRSQMLGMGSVPVQQNPAHMAGSGSMPGQQNQIQNWNQNQMPGIEVAQGQQNQGQNRTCNESSLFSPGTASELRATPVAVKNATALPSQALLNTMEGVNDGETGGGVTWPSDDEAIDQAFEELWNSPKALDL
ncbi:hypothetical protein V8F20_004798 [Naviculisporaceae sp. PSN 640]